ncbi:Protein phosphatase 2A, regulatory B subunit, B56 like protein [Aduncisulcus paluster]|uniref:Protein phosphatase 2A, regulatory B subunit, B56 like protein n=1 Tax=Aduncisulcus paluster TaxID=2918883 RepID=A0ABQ5K2V6_9EUKA|nr:Protein phosphatase 2A, regulatory B subunit, B56 like protein [Aduncisulcus paluster]
MAILVQSHTNILIPMINQNLPMEKRNLRDAKDEAVVSLFIMKLRQISLHISPLDSESEEAKAKKTLLREILDFMRVRPDVACCEPIIPEIVECVCKNIFSNRYHPPSIRRIHPTGFMQHQNSSLDVDFDEPRLDPAWDWIEMIYMMFLQMLISREFKVKVARKYITIHFLTQFIFRFQSDDPRERDFLKGALHRIYVKFVIYRAHIRRTFGYIFSMIASGSSRNEWNCTTGIAELLEILGSIINGFSQPLRMEHRHFLMHNLLPLHEIPRIRSFNLQLAQCTVQYVGREPELIVPIICRLVRIFPHCNAPKAILLLNELEELIESVDSAYYPHIAPPLVNLLERCCSSFHFQIAERTLVFLQNKSFQEMIRSNQKLVSKLVNSLCTNLSNHWNEGIIELSYSSMGTLLDLNRSVVEMSIFHFSEEEQVMCLRRRARFYSWEKIETSQGSDVDSIPGSQIITSRESLRRKLFKSIRSVVISPYDHSIVGADPLGLSVSDLDKQIAHEIVLGKRQFFTGDAQDLPASPASSGTRSTPSDKSLESCIDSVRSERSSLTESISEEADGVSSQATESKWYKPSVSADVTSSDPSSARHRRKSILPTTMEARQASEVLQEWVPLEQRLKCK